MDLGTASPFVRFTGHNTNIVQEATVTVTPTNNDDGDTVAGTVTIGLVDLLSGDWTQSFTTVGGGGAPHGTDDEVRLVYADNDVMFDTLTLLDLGGPRIHLDIGDLAGGDRERARLDPRGGDRHRAALQQPHEDPARPGPRGELRRGGRLRPCPRRPTGGTRSVTLPANTRSVQVTLPTEATTPGRDRREAVGDAPGRDPHVGGPTPWGPTRPISGR